jgi:hypothetical protein
MASSGAFVIAWHSPEDGFGYGVVARQFTSAGAPVGSQFQVNSFTNSQETFAAVATAPAGDFVVVWQTYGKESAANPGVSGQRFSAPVAPPTATLDVDGSGGNPDALTDGLLVLRYIFGFTGTTLVGNATSPMCTRCDGTQVKTYLDGLGATLDIDGGGGPLGPLTDGLLVLRYLFGFRGSTLTNNAVGDPCSRCDAAMIEPYLASLVD